MRMLVALGAAFLAVAPAMALADASEQTTQIPAAQAIELARLMSPGDLLVDMEVREFDKHFVPSLRSDPELRSLEEEYPGVFEAMHKASRGLVVEATIRSVEKIHAAVAKVIEASFTPADIAELTSFYRSPVGLKTLQQMAASADAGRVYQNAVSDSEFKLTEAQIDSQIHESAQKAAQTFTLEEQTEMMLFMAKPSFGKLAKAQPQIRQILANEFNAPDPEFDRRVEQEMGAAIERHIATFDQTGGK